MKKEETRRASSWLVYRYCSRVSRASREILQRSLEPKDLLEGEEDDMIEVDGEVDVNTEVDNPWIFCECHIELKAPYKNRFSYQSVAAKAKLQWFGESLLLSHHSFRRHIHSLLTDLFFVYYGIYYDNTFYTTTS